MSESNEITIYGARYALDDLRSLAAVKSRDVSWYLEKLPADKRSPLEDLLLVLLENYCEQLSPPLDSIPRAFSSRTRSSP